MKHAKKIIGIVIFFILIVLLAGVYKFDYLAGRKGHDVDGNHIAQQQGQKQATEKTDDELAHKKELQERLDRLGIKLEKVHDDFYDEDVVESVFYKLPPSGFNPVKNLSEVDRMTFKGVITADLPDDEITSENIMKNYPGFRPEDFKNTGKLLYQVDFDILLNNLLLRTGLEPHNGEQLDGLIDDLERGDL